MKKLMLTTAVTVELMIMERLTAVFMIMMIMASMLRLSW